jgi:hypothetical protein
MLVTGFVNIPSDFVSSIITWSSEFFDGFYPVLIVVVGAIIGVGVVFIIVRLLSELFHR